MKNSRKIEKNLLMGVNKYTSNSNNQKGITLIALAVTIIVLLILAGVTISSVFSENGIINKALQAQNSIDKAQQNDLDEINKLSNEVEKYLAGTQNVNEEEYATLNFQTFMGKFKRQKVNFERMRIEISDKENATDKITFHIGTDWKENIEKQNDNKNKLFFENNADLKMIQILEHDAGYSVDSEGKRTVRKEMISAFTDVKIENLKIKKEKEYTIKVFIQSASIVNGVAEARDLEVHTMDTGVINEKEKNIIVSKEEMVKSSTPTYFRIFDANGDGVCDGGDSSAGRQAIIGLFADEKLKFYVETNENKETVTQLMDEEGNLIDETYIGFDYNRDGCIDENDYQVFNKIVMTFGY